MKRFIHRSRKIIGDYEELNTTLSKAAVPLLNYFLHIHHIGRYEMQKTKLYYNQFINFTPWR
jgi:hypothetical protein